MLSLPSRTLGTRSRELPPGDGTGDPARAVSLSQRPRRGDPGHALRHHRVLRRSGRDPAADAADQRPEPDGGRQGQPRRRAAAPVGGSRRPRAEGPAPSLRVARRRCRRGRRGCKHMPGSSGADGGAVRRRPRGQVRLLESGQLDAALAELQKAPDDPESLYYQGRVWAKKAETAPLPTPPPPPVADAARLAAASGARVQARGDPGRRSSTRRPSRPSPTTRAAHLALAELLAPHAAHRIRPAPRRRGQAREAARRPPPPACRIDASVDRVIRAYQIAMQADPTSPAPVEELIRFGRRVGRVDAAEAGFKELVRRKREKETRGAARPLRGLPGRARRRTRWPRSSSTGRPSSGSPDDDADARARSPTSTWRWRRDAFAKQQYAVTED